MFKSKIYMPNIFVLTKQDDNYSYLFCHMGNFKFMPLFYNIDDINKTFADKTIVGRGTTDIKKIPAGKAELFLYCPAKPVIFTTLDRRSLNEVKYYGENYLNHVLLS